MCTDKVIRHGKSARYRIAKDLENGDLYLKNNPQKLALTKKTV